MSYRIREYNDAVKYESVKAEPSDLDASLDGVVRLQQDPMLLDGGISDQDSNPGSPIADDSDLLVLGRSVGLDMDDDDIVVDSRNGDLVTQFSFAPHGTAHSYETGRLSPGGLSQSGGMGSSERAGSSSSLVSAGGARGGGARFHLVSYSRRGRYKQWTDDQMERAMRLVQQHNFSNAKAAQEAGVPESSLRERLRKKLLRGEGFLSARRRRFDDPEAGISLDISSSSNMPTSGSGGTTGNKVNDALCLIFEHRMSIVTVATRMGISTELLKDNVRNIVASNALHPVNTDTCLTVEQERLIVKWINKRKMSYGVDWELKMSAFKDFVHSAVNMVEHLRPNQQKVFLSELVDEDCRKCFLSRNRALLNSYSHSGFGSFVVSSSDDRAANNVSGGGASSSLGAGTTIPLGSIVIASVAAERPSQSTATTSSTNQGRLDVTVPSPRSADSNFPLSSSSVSLGSLETASLPATSSSILVLQTGGDIDKEFVRTERGSCAFEIAQSSAQAVYSRLCPQLQVRFTSVCKKDSQDVSNADIAYLCTVCRENAAGRILITHGVDSILDTAQILASASYQKIIVLTGAVRPPALKESDVEFNLGFALGALQSLSQHGVYVAMDGRVAKWNELTFDRANRQFVDKK